MTVRDVVQIFGGDARVLQILLDQPRVFLVGSLRCGAAAALDFFSACAETGLDIRATNSVASLNFSSVSRASQLLCN